jgi:NAD(P)-dependent dehydrogenase (short-subunit alcohol dehydrogenase family)
MSDSFINKVGSSTGANSGIGAATSIALAHAGAKVVIAGRREEDAAAVVREIEQAGEEPLFVQTNVSREAAAAALVASTAACFGRLHFSVANLNTGAKTI